MKTLFIYNPNAGQTQIKNKLYDILNVFSKANYDLTVVPTKASGEATDYIKKNVNKFDLVVCSGGDGTLNEVVNGYLKNKSDIKPPLGYIPAGSTNDFANSLKLPKDMKKAAELVTNGKASLYDIGKFNNRYFVYVAAFGAFTSVAYATPQDIKNVIGHLAYLLEGIKSLTSIKAYKLKIKSKEYSTEGKFIYGMITNTYSVGGIYKFDKNKVSLDDGMLEVTLIKEPKDPIDMGEISSYFLGAISETKMVVSFKTNRITIETNEEMPWTLDGEYGDNPNKININVKQKIINIVDKNK